MAVLGFMLGCASTPRSSGTADARVETVRTFRSAEKRGDYDEARRLLAANPRVWYEKREGDGEPWELGEGSWTGWDREFHSQSRPLSDLQTEKTPWGDAVWVVVEESNDYYRLTERTYSLTMLMYFVDPDGKVSGELIAAVGKSSSRFDEFKKWAQEHEPQEFEALMPSGRIDPAGDHPQRVRALLERWRTSMRRPAP